MPSRPVVLIVDDDPHVAAVIAQTVEASGLRARVYTGDSAGPEAFAAMAAPDAPSLAASVIDLNLDRRGVLSGVWLRRAMDHLGFAEPSMLLTGAYTDDSVRARLLATFDAVENKPLTRAKLLSFLDAAVVNAAHDPRHSEHPAAVH